MSHPPSYSFSTHHTWASVPSSPSWEKSKALSLGALNTVKWCASDYTVWHECTSWDDRSASLGPRGKYSVQLGSLRLRIAKMCYQSLRLGLGVAYYLVPVSVYGVQQGWRRRGGVNSLKQTDFPNGLHFVLPKSTSCRNPGSGRWIRARPKHFRSVLEKGKRTQNPEVVHQEEDESKMSQFSGDEFAWQSAWGSALQPNGSTLDLCHWRQNQSLTCAISRDLTRDTKDLRCLNFIDIPRFSCYG